MRRDVFEKENSSLIQTEASTIISVKELTAGKKVILSEE